MSLSVKITDLTVSIDLVYNASNQTAYALKYGGRINPPETTVLLHQSPDGEQLPVRAYDPDRSAYFTLDILGSTQDALLENITILKRWIDGADQQALRSYLTGDVKPIYIRVKADGATNATLHRIKWGWVDDGGAAYQSIQLASGKIAPDVVLMAHLESYGVAENPIILENIVPSSPHAVEDTDNDGVADGWATAGTYPTFATSGSYWLIGGKSQKMVCTTNAEDQAISCPLASCLNTADLKASIWIAAISSANDVVKLMFRTGTGETMETKTFDPGNPTGYDFTLVNQGSGAAITFYRYSFTSISRSGANARIRVVRQSGDASAGGNYFVDGAYIVNANYWDANTMAFGSTWQIRSRGDLSAGNEDRICYVDLWGIPGDAVAQVRIQGTPHNLSWDHCYLVSDRDGKHAAGRYVRYWIEDDELSYFEVGTGTWNSRTSDSSRTDGGYRRYSGGAATDSFKAYIEFTGDAARAMAEADKRIFVLARAADVSEVKFWAVANEWAQPGFYWLSTDNTWELLDLGILKLQQMIHDEAPTDGTISLQIEVCGYCTGAPGNVEFDALILLPTESFLVHKTFVSGNVWYDGRQNVVIFNTGRIAYDQLGTFVGATGGPTMTRIIWLPVTPDYEPDADLETLIYVWPRTRGLLSAK